MIIPFEGKDPAVGKNAFIAPDAWLIGDVAVGENVSIFFGAVLRGDVLPIRVGSGTNIQEHALLHTTEGRSPTIIGQNCTIGHRAIVHGCTVGARCLIGMGATVLDDAVIEDECLVGANSLITEGKRFPARSLILGSPAKVVRSLTDDEVEEIISAGEEYVKTGAKFRALLKKP